MTYADHMPAVSPLTQQAIKERFIPFAIKEGPDDRWYDRTEYLAYVRDHGYFVNIFCDHNDTQFYPFWRSYGVGYVDVLKLLETEYKPLVLNPNYWRLNRPIRYAKDRKDLIRQAIQIDPNCRVQYAMTDLYGSSLLMDPTDSVWLARNGFAQFFMQAKHLIRTGRLNFNTVLSLCTSYPEVYEPEIWQMYLHSCEAHQTYYLLMWCFTDIPVTTKEQFVPSWLTDFVSVARPNRWLGL